VLAGLKRGEVKIDDLAKPLSKFSDTSSSTSCFNSHNATLPPPKGRGLTMGSTAIFRCSVF
jgi:hypothetical protein